MSEKTELYILIFKKNLRPGYESIEFPEWLEAMEFCDVAKKEAISGVHFDGQKIKEFNPETELRIYREGQEEAGYKLEKTY